MRILVRLVLKVFRNNLKILCHPIYTWLCNKYAQLDILSHVYFLQHKYICSIW